MRVLPTVLDGAPALAVLVDDDSAAVVGWGTEQPRGGPTSPIVALLAGGAAALDSLRERASVARHSGAMLPLADLSRTRLITDPVKILCVGFNYNLHATEMSAEPPSSPNVFCKFLNSVVGPGEAIILPNVSRQVDYEGELAAVIGRRCFDVSVDDALSYVGGYTIMNDVSARDLQFETSQWTLGKAIDTFAPLGPVLTLAEAVPDPQDLSLTTRLNGVVVQDAHTSDMIFNVAQIVSTISRSMTLECGDIIATGTPEGVGYKRTPQRFLQDGDIVEIAISGIGTLTNPVRQFR